MADNAGPTPAPAPMPAESTAVDLSVAAEPPIVAQPSPARAQVAAPAPNLAVGVSAGFGFGLLAALVAAAVEIVAGHLFIIPGLLIAIAIAFGFHRFGHTRGVAPAIIAAVMAFVLYFVSIFIEGAGAVAKLYDTSFIDGLRSVIENAGTYLSEYFSEGRSYLFLIVSVLMAGYYAYGARFGKHRR